MPTIEETPCPLCGKHGLTLGLRLHAKPPTAASLAGTQLKVTAIEYLAWTCPDCDAHGPAEQS